MRFIRKVRIVLTYTGRIILALDIIIVVLVKYVWFCLTERSRDEEE